MIVINILVMWVKQGHKPAMTGNGETTTEKNLVMTGGWCVYDFFWPTLILFFRGAIATNLRLCPVLSIKRRNKEWMLFQRAFQCVLVPFRARADLQSCLVLLEVRFTDGYWEIGSNFRASKILVHQYRPFKQNIVWFVWFMVISLLGAVYFHKPSSESLTSTADPTPRRRSEPPSRNPDRSACPCTGPAISGGSPKKTHQNQPIHLRWIHINIVTI